MSVFDFLKKKEEGLNKDEVNESETLVKKYIDEMDYYSKDYYANRPGNIDALSKIQKLSEETIKFIILFAIDTYKKTEFKSLLYLITCLLKKPISYTDEELLFITENFNSLLIDADSNDRTKGARHSHEGNIAEIERLLVSKIEINIIKNELSLPLTEALNLLLLHDGSYDDILYLGSFLPQRRKNKKHEKFLLQGSGAIADNGDLLGQSILDFLSSIKKKSEKKDWENLFKCLIDSTDKSCPSEKWMNEVRLKIDKIGFEPVIKQYEEWILLCMPEIKRYELLTPVNKFIFTGLIWSCGILNNAGLNSLIEKCAVTIFIKLGLGGPVKIGNACLYALSALPIEEGIYRLTKSKFKIKSPVVSKQIDKLLEKAATKAGFSKDKLEEITVPDYGVKNRKIIRQAGAYEAVITINAVADVSLIWKSGEKEFATIPAEIKNDYKEDLSEIKTLKKEIEDLLPAQRDRIEKFFLRSLEWEYEEWFNAYLSHPIMDIISRDLIWYFDDGSNKSSGIYFNGQIVDCNNNPLPGIKKGTRVKLWHPIGVAVKEVLDWRKFLETQKIKQPFKQAYREVYIITDAEINTNTYSNRFAANILRQQQFAVLCKQRGWKYALMGEFYGNDSAILNIPYWNLDANFYVSGDGFTDNTNGYGVYNYVRTGMVMFSERNKSISLTDVPAMVFSEILRDVDLFVGVSSIGNDPLWEDNSDEIINTYRQNYSFTELSETAKIRESVLKQLVPRLKIASQCSFDGKYLIVKGKLKEYKIHIGSGNILMTHNNQYVCIVPKSSAKVNSKVFLPFEGDHLLSVIISKALMLAEDDKIKDSDIINQINRS